MDVVFTWVDDSFPGYLDLRDRYSATKHDRNPNRTRDNLDVLRFGLRSLRRHLPWVRRVFIVTCRPQVPAWLDTSAPGVHVVHHDEFIDGEYLPTFNSFAIVSNLHRIAGLSERFLYVEDDKLFMRDIEEADVTGGSHRIPIYEKLERTHGGHLREQPGLSPWNAALAWSNHLLDERYRRRRRGMVHDSPLMIERATWERMISTWSEDFRRTTGSRFRAPRNVAPEHLYPHFLIHEGVAEPVALTRAYRWAAYHSVDNVLPLQHLSLSFLRALRPKFCCFNDNFDDAPNPRVVALVRRKLAQWFPTPSPWELRA